MDSNDCFVLFFFLQKKDCKSHVYEEQQGLSLPIEEKVSVKVGDCSVHFSCFRLEKM